MADNFSSDPVSADELLRRLAEMNSPKPAPNPYLFDEMQARIDRQRQGVTTPKPEPVNPFLFDEIQERTDRQMQDRYAAQPPQPSQPPVNPMLFDDMQARMDRQMQARLAAQGVPEDQPERGRGYGQPTDSTRAVLSNPFGTDAYTPPGASAAGGGLSPPPPPPGNAPAGQPGASRGTPGAGSRGPRDSYIVKTPLSGPRPGEGADLALPQDDILKTDPRDALVDTYKPAMHLAMQARAEDLERMKQAEGFLQQQMGIMGTAGNHAAQASFANQLGALQSKPRSLETLELAGKAGEQMAKAQREAWALDPNSPISKEAKIAYISSKEFDESVRQIAQDSQRNPLDVKKEMYARVKGLTAVGIGAFQEVMRKSGDYSKQRAEEATQYALKKQYEASAAALNVETQNKAFVFKNLQNPKSLISQSLRATIAAINPAASSVPGFENMSGADLFHSYPGLMDASAQIMKFRQEYNIKLQGAVDVDNDWQVRTTYPEGMAGGLSGLAVPNQEGVANKAAFRSQNQAARTALDYYDNLSREAGNLGPGATFTVSLKTDRGRKITQDMLNYAEAVSYLSPYGKELSDELKRVATGSTYDAGSFLFGSKQGREAQLVTALNKMNSDHQKAAAPFVNKTIESGGIPALPPTWLPLKAIDREVKILGRDGKPMNVNGYVFQLGNKTVVYYRDSAGNWQHNP